MSETNRPNIFIVRLLFCLPGILSILGLEPALSHGKNVLLSASRLPWQLAYNFYCLCFLIKSPVKAHGRGGMKLVGGRLHAEPLASLRAIFSSLVEKIGADA